MGEKKYLEMVVVDGDRYYKIPLVDTLRPFFMSIVSHSDHWMFISSNGGLSCGRKNSDLSLFPYYTVDKIIESYGVTGSCTLIKVKNDRSVALWEPFRGSVPPDHIERNLYKTRDGNAILFEEINRDEHLAFRYSWKFSDRFGFVRESSLINLNHNDCEVEFIDGIQNILPAKVPSDLQVRASNLVDAYKRSELDEQTKLGIYALSATIVDKAEPSEALKANVAWHHGMDEAQVLLSSLQLDCFRRNQTIVGESDIKGEKGAYLLHSSMSIPAQQSKNWWINADLNKDHREVVDLLEYIAGAPDIDEDICADIEVGRKKLRSLVSRADGIQKTADHLRDSRHFSNVLFNIMRGGIFEENYRIPTADFKAYLDNANAKVAKKYEQDLARWQGDHTLHSFRSWLQSQGDEDLYRLGQEYLPLMFSRRHGDPSRPWNQFSINTQDEDGHRVLDYQGNWRDIFQNWEALAISFPEFLDGMIFKFLNASTFDGYNPYRIFKDGFDWETIEEDDPWSYIGYWGDHQIIYLLKFLESAEKRFPGRLASYLDRECFVYAAVPYVIKKYEDIISNPKDTIIFDHEWDAHIRDRRAKIGSDGALLWDEQENIVRVNMMEKLLATVLAKLSNFVPDAGIWLNTQRPEWNDANNALVGNGVSMVTLFYLRRFVVFLEDLVAQYPGEEIKVSGEFVDYYHGIRKVLATKLKEGVTAVDRKKMMDQLGSAASDYREHIYLSGFWGKKRSISISHICQFLAEALSWLESSVHTNKREDGMYHAYNLISIGREEVSVDHLEEMLEGQVAVLSSGCLSAKESLEVLDAMKASPIFRPDQYSYMLYPNKQIKGFLERNTIPQDRVVQSELFERLVWNGDKTVITKDARGAFHFNGDFKNANDLATALEALDKDLYGELVEKETGSVLQIFEEVFDHKSFTGRSGTFFGYEGLGSIYWHMVSKLLVAVQEVSLQAIFSDEDPEVIGGLLDHYYEIQAGIGVHKPVYLYGAFPTDPYSHTPAGRGAQQPGMTGQVKEDILVRMAELGVLVREGKIVFYPHLLRESREFVKEDSVFEYFDVHQESREIPLEKGSLGFTYCQVPVIYQASSRAQIEVHHSDGKVSSMKGMELDEQTSQNIMKRTGEINRLIVHVPKTFLK